MNCEPELSTAMTLFVVFGPLVGVLLLTWWMER